MIYLQWIVGTPAGATVVGWWSDCDWRAANQRARGRGLRGSHVGGGSPHQSGVCPDHMPTGTLTQFTRVFRYFTDIDLFIIYLLG